MIVRRGGRGVGGLKVGGEALIAAMSHSTSHLSLCKLWRTLKVIKKKKERENGGNDGSGVTRVASPRDGRLLSQ